MTDDWPADWKCALLGDIADVNWGDTGTTKAAYTASGFPAYSASGFDGFLPYADFERTGVVLSAIGADCGKTFLARGRWSCIKNTIRFWSKTSEVDTEFLYWLTREPSVWPRRGSAQPFISQGDARKLQIAYPSICEQRAIAHILGTLDDKIEVNRRMSATLEAMARALFKSWFVHFDPARAKAEGRDPGLPPDFAALFPDRLVETDDGEVPEGWEAKPLSSLAHFLNGLPLQRYRASDPSGSLPVIKIAELRNGISANTDRASRDVPDDYVVHDGDFLFSWSGSLLAKFWTEGEGALNQHLFKVTSQRYPRWFFAEWVHVHLEEFERIAAYKATTMGHIQRSHLNAALTNCPPDDVIARFSPVFEPMIERTIQAALESRTLAAIRDTLLPKLVSGELRVNDAETFLDRVL